MLEIVPTTAVCFSLQSLADIPVFRCTKTSFSDFKYLETRIYLCILHTYASMSFLVHDRYHLISFHLQVFTLRTVEYRNCENRVFGALKYDVLFTRVENTTVHLWSCERKRAVRRKKRSATGMVWRFSSDNALLGVESLIFISPAPVGDR